MSVGFLSSVNELINDEITVNKVFRLVGSVFNTGLISTSIESFDASRTYLDASYDPASTDL